MSHSYNIVDHEGNGLVHEKANLNNVNIHYCIGGPVDGPAVMLGMLSTTLEFPEASANKQPVHGIPKTMFTFRKVIPYLTPKDRVVAVDLRGFGDSERPATGYDCGTMASDLTKLADHVGFDKFRVVGEDRGAAFAYTLAASYRDRVVGLVYQEMILPGLGFEDRIHLTGGTDNAQLRKWIREL
jgi:hypothetical protein